MRLSFHVESVMDIPPKSPPETAMSFFLSFYIYMFQMGGNRFRFSFKSEQVKKSARAKYGEVGISVTLFCKSNLQTMQNVWITTMQ